MINVLIVDDHQLSILGAQAMLRNDNRINVIGQITNGSDVLDYIKDKKIDVILLDLYMKDIDGFEILKMIKEYNSGIKVIMLTISEDKDSILKILSLKADGFISKDISSNELISSIDRVLNNEYAYSLKILNKLIPEFMIYADMLINNKDRTESLHQSNNVNESSLDLTEKLTKRELEILKLIGDGMSSNEMSEKLNLSIFTINTYRKNINSKLGNPSLKKLVDIGRTLIKENNI